MTKAELAKYIDQTLLKPQATAEQVSAFIKEAIPYNFASVCINQVYVPLARELLKESSTKVCTVIDFPLGAGGTQAKITQAVLAIEQGADEIDFVIDIGLVKSHDWSALEQQLCELTKAVRQADSKRASKPRGPVVEKLILETCLLTDEEITESSKCAKNAGFDFVKTSTGFSTGGATTHAVSLMRQAVGPELGVKASGGIHNTQEALDMINAGASRIGASAGLPIVDGYQE